MPLIKGKYSTNFRDWLEFWTEHPDISLWRTHNVTYIVRAALKATNVVLRYDIDSIKDGGRTIMKMADTMEELGVFGSFYIIPDDFNYKYYTKSKDLFLGLQKRGHEIGLHVNSAEASHSPKWTGRLPKVAVIRLKHDIKRMKDDGFNVWTMAAHGIGCKYTNRNVMEDYDNNIPMAFHKSFQDSECFLSDSRKQLTIADDIDILPGNAKGSNNLKNTTRIGYVLLHPESFTLNLDTIARNYFRVRDLPKGYIYTL